jgi:cell wall-associated NlpC family hydrolase
MTGTPNGTSRTDDHYWWYWRDGGVCLWDCTHWTQSWSFADHLKQYLTYHYPGGWFRGTRSGMDLSAKDDVGIGDLLFFDWGYGDGWSHVRIQVGYGTSYDGHYGAYTDQHTNNRYHAFWSAYYENAAHRTTTTIYEMNVDTRN